MLLTWQVFWLKRGVLADRAIEVLCDRARAGVRVLCLVDAYGARGVGDVFAERLRAHLRVPADDGSRENDRGRRPVVVRRRGRRDRLVEHAARLVATLL